MAHFPKPFFKAKRNTWYVEIDRRQINLGPDEAEAFRRYHELMAAKPDKPTPRTQEQTPVVALLDAFLDTLQRDADAARTFEWYQRHLQNLVLDLPSELQVGQLKKMHLTEALAKHADWSPSTRNGYCRCAIRALAWAEEQGMIPASPLRGFKKPRPGRRDKVVSAEEFQAILAAFPDPDFRELLITVWETGCRPQEITAVEARHVDLERGRWVFPAQESKGKRFPRVVYLNDKALAITRERCQRYPAGRLFRNSQDKPWHRYAVNCCFTRLQTAVGLKALRASGELPPPPPRFRKDRFHDQASITAARAEQERLLYERRKQADKLARKLAPKYNLYTFRHSFATHALRRGVDALTVAILLGHTDPSTLAKVYAHLAQDPDFLRKAVLKATGGEGA